MKIKLQTKECGYITDNSKECDKDTAFFISEQSRQYTQDAKEHGAKAFISPEELKKIYGIQDIKIVGITGTNGKTTTAAAIYSLLLDLGEKAALQGTRGFFINDEKIKGKGLTTPSIFNTLNNLKKAKDQGCGYFIMEVSSHAIDQNRIEGLDFALKVFTNLTQDHLDYHKSFEEYRAVKSSFFQDESKKLINKDAKKIDFNIKNCYTYAADLPSTFAIAAYSMNDGISAVLKHFEKLVNFHSPLHGLFNLYNLTAAIGAISMMTEYSLEKICEEVENFAGVSGRMETVSNDPLVIVDFAHTADGIKNVLDSIKNRDLIVVFGAGGDRDRSKRALMGAVAEKFSKKLIITSDNPRSEDPMDIIRDIIEGVDEESDTLVIPDRKKAIEVALDSIEDPEKEAVFILGKGDEEYQEIKGKKIPFEDKKIVLEILSQA